MMVAVEPHSRPLCHMICGQLLAVRSRGDKLVLAQVRVGGVWEVWEVYLTAAGMRVWGKGREFTCAERRSRRGGGRGGGEACTILQHRDLTLMQRHIWLLAFPLLTPPRSHTHAFTLMPPHLLPHQVLPNQMTSQQSMTQRRLMESFHTVTISHRCPADKMLTYNCTPGQSVDEPLLVAVEEQGVGLLAMQVSEGMGNGV